MVIARVHLFVKDGGVACCSTEDSWRYEMTAKTISIGLAHRKAEERERRSEVCEPEILFRRVLARYQFFLQREMDKKMKFDTCTYYNI